MPVDLASLIVDVAISRAWGRFLRHHAAGPHRAGFAAAIDKLDLAAPLSVDLVLGLEARGFIFAAPVTYGLEVGFVPVRKPGKLPRDVVSVRYDLEYGNDTLAMIADAVPAGSRVLIVNDVLATGGTVAATADLVAQLGAEVAGVLVVAELAFLNPRARLTAHGLTDITALVTIEAR